MPILRWIEDQFARAQWRWWTRPRRAQAVSVWHEVAREQTLDPRDWQALQVKRLRTLLVHAAERVPYYRQLFSQSRFDPYRADLPNGLAELPVLTKDLVRAHATELLTTGIDTASLTPNSTGGSTGVPLSFFQDARYRVVSEALGHLVKQWWGIQPYEREAYIWGADRDLRDRGWQDRWYEWRRRRRGLNAFRMDDAALVEFCRMLVQWKPRYLAGYATALETLAHCADRHGIQPTFRAIRSSAEVLLPRQRELIERVFNSPVYDFYGSREVNNLAAECPEGRQMHLISSWRYLEIADDDGQPVPADHPGNVLVTDLSNFAMPFIRYRNEDRATIASERCRCGRPTPVLQSLHGRRTDVIVLPSGEKIHGEWFTHLFYATRGIRQFQIHQTNLDQIIVRYVPGDDSHTADAKRVITEIAHRVGSQVRLILETCDSIPCGPSGKHRFTLSDIAQSSSGAGAALTEAIATSVPRIEP